MSGQNSAGQKPDGWEEIDWEAISQALSEVNWNDLLGRFSNQKIEDPTEWGPEWVKADEVENAGATRVNVRVGGKKHFFLKPGFGTPDHDKNKSCVYVEGEGPNGGRLCVWFFEADVKSHQSITSQREINNAAVDAQFEAFMRSINKANPTSE